MSNILTQEEVDQKIGQKLRFKRLMLGYTMQEIADMIGISFQQIQKYEKGRNQLTVNKLYLLANVLGEDLSFFTEQFNNPATKLADSDRLSSYAEHVDKDLAKLIGHFSSIKNDGTKKKIVDLVRTLADE